MAKTTIRWNWDEAFSKFGFGDGDGEFNGTAEVATFIRSKGYEVECDSWGMHNYMIMDVIKVDPKTGVGVSIVPKDITVGYDHPSGWLPKSLLTALNKKFGKSLANW